MPGEERALAIFTLGMQSPQPWPPISSTWVKAQRGPSEEEGLCSGCSLSTPQQMPEADFPSSNPPGPLIPTRPRCTP